MMSYFWNVLTSQGSFEVLALLMLAAAKATLLLVFAASLCFAVRRFSAETRHLLWASALCASLILPFLSFMQVWEVPILPQRMSGFSVSGATVPNANFEVLVKPEARTPPGLSGAFEADAVPKQKSEFQRSAEVPVETSQTLNTSAPPPATQTGVASFLPELVNWALGIWAIGALLLLFRLLIGFTATCLLTRRAVEFVDPSLTDLFSSLLREVNLKPTVRLLRSERTLMPIVYGILRPAVLLPAGAERWSEKRRRLVLLHELTHVTRRDCLTQLMAQMACAFYWFNPLIWYAARRLRVEREQACDDYVLRIGTKPSDYADHLLDIARSMQERSLCKWSQTNSVAMARRSQLEGRLLAILSKENKRRAVSRAVTANLLALICVLLLSLAPVRPTVIHAQHPRPSHNASPVGNEEVGSASTNSFASVDARRSEAASAVHEARVGKHEADAPHAFDGAPSPSLNDVPVGREAGPRVAANVEGSTGQNAAVSAAPQRATAGVAMPEAVDPNGGEANVFTKVEYRQQDGEPRAQNRPGDFIDEMASAGYTNLSVDELVKLKTAGVTASDVRSLRALGFTNLTVKELASIRIHGLTPAYIQSIRAAGYNDLSAKELTTFRIHGITPEYIKALRDAGHGNLAAKQLIDFKVHQVTAEFIGSIRAAGYGNASPKELVSLRVYQITPEFIRRARGRLGELTLKQIISLKSMGMLDDDGGKDKVKDKG
jgi:beta-lactamase regulating signal transducer with metallopeptidase domain